MCAASRKGLLVSRKPWTRLLLDAVETGQVNARDLPLDLVRRMTMHKDDDIAASSPSTGAKWQGATTARCKNRSPAFEHVIRKAKARLPGKKHFLATCAKCTRSRPGRQHRPELTTYKRDDLSTMLLHIVNPSAEIREGFETHLVVTGHGRGP